MRLQPVDKNNTKCNLVHGTLTGVSYQCINRKIQINLEAYWKSYPKTNSIIIIYSKVIQAYHYYSGTVEHNFGRAILKNRYAALFHTMPFHIVTMSVKLQKGMRVSIWPYTLYMSKTSGVALYEKHLFLFTDSISIEVSKEVYCVY